MPAHVPQHVAQPGSAIPWRDGTGTAERQQLIHERSWVQALPGFTFTSLSRSLCSPSLLQTLVFTVSVPTASVIQTLVFTLLVSTCGSPRRCQGGRIAGKLDVSSASVSTTSVLQTLVFTFSLADVAVTLGYKSSARQRPVKARRLGLAVLPRETASPYEPTTIGRR